MINILRITNNDARMISKKNIPTRNKYTKLIKDKMHSASNPLLQIDPPQLHATDWKINRTQKANTLEGRGR